MTTPTWLHQKNLIAMKIEFVGSVSHLNAKCLNSETFWFIKRQEGHRLNLSVVCCFFIFLQRCQHRVNLSLLFPSWPSGNCQSVVLRKKKMAPWPVRGITQLRDPTICHPTSKMGTWGQPAGPVTPGLGPALAFPGCIPFLSFPLLPRLP